MQANWSKTEQWEEFARPRNEDGHVIKLMVSHRGNFTDELRKDLQLAAEYPRAVVVGDHDHDEQTSLQLYSGAAPADPREI
jgi:hypothetical protein